MARPDECELNPELVYEVNVKGVENITKYAECKIIYFSTDYVFDGRKGFYSEEDIPSPINYYGTTKLIAEEIVLRHSKDNVVLRVAGLYGYNPRNNEFLKSFNAPILHRANDLLGSTLLINDAVKYLPFFMKGSGLYHLSSSSAISRYDFALMCAHILGLPAIVVGKPYKELYSIAKRPYNTSLISVKHKLKIYKEQEGLNLVRNSLRRGDTHER
jgi:dTDP-4-dehydrorhamnose reductase